MSRRFNAKKKPKHMGKNKWTYFDKIGYVWNSGLCCKPQSWTYGLKFKFHKFKTTRDLGHEIGDCSGK